MSHLYHTLAKVYEAMYQTFMDYQAEYAFYAPLVRKHQAQSLLELGCGTGNMADLFRQDGIGYLGVDLSEEMLALAREKHPADNFYRADISEFSATTPKDAILMIGRTISYLTTTKSVRSCFQASFKNLSVGGVLIFDFIDATKFIPTLDPAKTIEHKASFAGKHYLRESRWTVNLKEGFQFDWAAEYFELQEDGKQRLGEDFSTIRTFTEAELSVLLQMAGFHILEVIDKTSYAFPTKVIVARKDA
jgi:SAM-dependent methyltransferase